jgi:hypothetical protein
MATKVMNFAQEVIATRDIFAWGTKDLPYFCPMSKINPTYCLKVEPLFLRKILRKYMEIANSKLP